MISKYALKCQYWFKIMISKYALKCQIWFKIKIYIWFENKI